MRRIFILLTREWDSGMRFFSGILFFNGLWANMMKGNMKSINHHSQGQTAELLGIKFHHQQLILWIWYYPKQNGGVDSIMEVRVNTFSKLLWVWFIFLQTVLMVFLLLKCMRFHSQLRSYLQLTNVYIAKPYFYPAESH